eukprot:9476484-Karenia_brevis.AAC.1
MHPKAPKKTTSEILSPKYTEVEMLPYFDQILVCSTMYPEEIDLETTETNLIRQAYLQAVMLQP